MRSFDCDPSREGLHSRFGRPMLCPDPVQEPDKLARLLLDLAAQESKTPFLFPCNDKFARFVSERRQELAPRFSFVLTDPARFQALMSKQEMYDLAHECGVPTPRTARVIPGRSTAGDVPEDFPFPALLKPAYAYTLWGITRGKVVVVRDRVETARALTELPEGEAFALQEVIPGPESALFYYDTYRDRRGDTLAEFCSRKVRQFPPGFGTSTLFESLLDDEVLKIGRTLFDRLGHVGLASAEFKRDPRDNRLKLIEVNTRLWLYHPLSAAAGVDYL